MQNNPHAILNMHLNYRRDDYIMATSGRCNSFVKRKVPSTKLSRERSHQDAYQKTFLIGKTLHGFD